MVPRACSVLGQRKGRGVWHSRAGCRSSWCLWLSAAVGCTELFWEGHGATRSFMPVLLLHCLIKRIKPTYKGMEFIKSGRVVNNLMFAFSNRGNDRRA